MAGICGLFILLDEILRHIRQDTAGASNKARTAVLAVLAACTVLSSVVGGRRRDARYCVCTASVGGRRSGIDRLGRPDVLVQPEEVVRVVGALQARQPRVVRAVAGPYTLLAVFAHKVDIDTRCRERLD